MSGSSIGQAVKGLSITWLAAGWTYFYILLEVWQCRLAREIEEMRRAMPLGALVNRYAAAARALAEMGCVYREMLVELIDYAVKYKVSMETLHTMIYARLRESCPWLPTRVFIGDVYRDNYKLLDR